MKLRADAFPKIIIEIPDSESLWFAGDELLRYARIMFGKDLRFSENSVFAIGLDPDDKALGAEGYRVRIGPAAIRVSGGSPLGALYGVYSFLRDFCGCCFAAPGANGEFVPEVGELRLPEAEVCRNPLLSYRGMQFTERFPWQQMIDAFDWMAKNGFNYVMYLPLENIALGDLKAVDPNTGAVIDYGQGRYNNAQFREHLLPEIRKRGLRLDMSHHNLLGAWLPPARYFEDHPEWYPLIDGRRQARSPQLAICSSNREAVNEIIKNVKTFLRENPEVEVVGVIPQDGYGACCRCDNCATLDDPEDALPTTQTYRSPEGENRLVSNRYALFLNQVAEGVTDEFADVRIGAAFYVDLQWPPRRVKLHKNILPHVAMYWRCGAHRLERGAGCRINDFFRGILAQWAEAKPHDFILYEYYMGMNAQSSLPYPVARVITEEWPALRELGVQGATLQTNPLNYRIYGVNYLAFAAAAWNEEVDYGAVLDYWLKGMFGAAAPGIRPIFEALDRAMSKVDAGTEHDCLKYVPPAVGHILPNANNIAFFMDELTPACIDERVDEARRLAACDRERAQVEEFAAAAGYWELAAEYFRLRQRALAPDFPGFTDSEMKDFRAKWKKLEDHRLTMADTGWARMSGPIKLPSNIKRRGE